VVVIEKGGYGASAAAPVARDGFQYLVNNPPVPVVLSAPVASGATSTTSTTPGTRTTPTTAPAH
jgi:hypothetical protein